MARILNKRKVLVALSGGVDSAVAVILLLEQGYEVVGAFMKNWSGDSGKSPCWIDDRRDAIAVAAHLGIPMVTFDFEKEYREHVVEYMYREYAAGRTPNPDIVCNRTIKFDLFVKEAKKMGVATIATGHYARVLTDSEGIVHLLKGLDSNKDQTYFLHQLTQEQLKNTLFPLGELKKDEVRKIAAERGLAIANKRSSRGICFVGKVSLPVFLKECLAVRNGVVVDTEGNILGAHTGIHNFTIGQRHGLSISGSGQPYFIVDKNPETNVITVAFGENHPRLFSKQCRVKEMHWISGIIPSLPFHSEVQIRYRHKGSYATISKIDSDYLIDFDIPERAVAPGQFAVVYNNDECIGGGAIESTE